MNNSVKQGLLIGSVWTARIIVGIVFIIAGWAKAIDPWGFAIKIGEYLSVWHWEVSHEVIVTGAASLACIEFAVGAAVLTGILRRGAVRMALLMMAFMLPLSLYIAVANPVADCGCFGDLLLISNSATFAKNIAISALLTFLAFTNHKIAPLYPAPMQWLGIVASLVFPLLLVLFGYQVQPLVDFRPYKNGTTIFAPQDASSAQEVYIYEKDGEQREFTLDNLPDESWTFVESPQPKQDPFAGGIAVFDEDGEDVSELIVADNGSQLFLTLPEPSLHYLKYAHLVEALSKWCNRHEVELIGIVAGSDSAVSQWQDLTQPDFAVYQSDDKALKQLVRGYEGLVYTEDGIIQWKRTLSSMPDELTEDYLTAIKADDNGRLHNIIAGSYILWMLVLYVLSLSPRMVRFFICHTIKRKKGAQDDAGAPEDMGGR